MPYVVETSIGLDRMFLAILSSSYVEEELENDSIRTVLKIPPFLAPQKAAILPLVKKDGLSEYARKIFASGNELDHIHYPHLIHGFVNMTVLRAAKEASLDFIKTYKTYFSK